MLNQTRLIQLLHYEPSTGAFTWREPPRTSPRKQGDPAGGATTKGYLSIRIDGRLHKAHRLAWLYVHGAWPVGLIDHRDDDHGNNRISNLRDASKRINAENLRKPHRDNASGLLGVTRNHDRWCAQISVDGAYRYLGTHDTPALAHAAYVAAKREFHVGCTI